MAEKNTDITETSFLSGQLLLAMPSMGDPRFERAVVYIIEHNENGATGVIINKPFDAIAFADLLEQLDIETDDEATPDIKNRHVLFGGPVDIGRGFVIHSSDVLLGHTKKMTEEIAVTTSMDMLRLLAEGEGPEKSLFILGYAGWEADQLDEEIKANAWLTCEATASLLFDVPVPLRWQTALESLGIDPQKLSSAFGTA